MQWRKRISRRQLDKHWFTGGQRKKAESPETNTQSRSTPSPQILKILIDNLDNKAEAKDGENRGINDQNGLNNELLEGELSNHNEAAVN